VAGALLLTVCCASLANAASDSERMVETARRAECAAHISTMGARPYDVDVCCAHHHHGEHQRHHG
jgi:hypothetical protein